jgi:hypothetical protein
LFGVVTSLVGMWVTENKLDMSDRPFRDGIAVVRVPPEENAGAVRRSPKTSSSSAPPPQPPVK